MSRAAPSFVLGYHGCDREIGMKAVCGQVPLVAQDRAYHWLGTGIYFWENDRDRALEWAQEKQTRGEISDPFVIGAIIDLGHCLDLHVRENAHLLKRAYDHLEQLFADSGATMPKNKKARHDPREDKVLRYLDCAVINYLHTLTKDKPFDTVRGLFVEGQSIYPDGQIFHKTHSEIAVCNRTSIIGLFLPR
ncbi:MAG: hypothetical protein ACREEB_00770 [Caulobacteraceae bacterium]